MDQITKRLHISGLTPQITASDLTSRFSSFGTVKSLDGLGKLDGLGSPRPYAYVTVESTKPQLAKCVNVLSGTTWKGAKLRVGEARPDFHERIAKENNGITKRPNENSDSPGPPRKRKRLSRGCQGRQSSDMEPITPESATKRPGWTKTPLGRLIRPMRMRPLHPLPDVVPLEKAQAKVAKKSKDAKFVKEKRKKRSAKVLTRARRRTIDPTRFGSRYLKGVLLEGSTRPFGIGQDTEMADLEGERAEEADDVGVDGGSEVESEGEDDEFNDNAVEIVVTPDDKQDDGTSSDPTPVSPPSPPLQPIPVPPHLTSSTQIPGNDIASEAAHALSLLSNIFDAEADEWGGEESLSDIDMDAIDAPTNLTTLGGARVNGGDLDDFEIVPMEKGKVEMKAKGKVAAKSREAKGKERKTNVASDAPATSPEPHNHPESASKPQPPTDSRTQMRKLKDLFAPQQESAGFSLLGNLDVDLELDDVLDFATASSAAPVRPAKPLMPASHFPPAPSTAPTTKHHPIHLDTSLPLFFPLPTSFPDPSQPASHPTSFHLKGKNAFPKDVVSAFEARGWDPLVSGFHRTESSEEIKARWEGVKVELTRGWKKRWREGVKSVKRRGGGGGYAE
ncbi:hypothetical protein BD410DRAFT_825658, partial [Rickenella mellea]